MAVNAGRVVVNLQAGTAQFILDMDKANKKLAEFGHGSVNNLQATSAALRVLEGNMTNNLRAAERFVSSLPGVGAALKAAFPVVGGIATIGILSELVDKAEKVKEAIDKIRDSAATTGAAFGSLNVQLGKQNDELDLSNAKLANEIAKLEGTRQNGLAVALAAARVEADKLAESLERDLNAVEKVLQENKVGLLGNLLGKAGTGDIADEFRSTVQRLSSLAQQGRDALSLAEPGTEETVQANSRRSLYDELAKQLQHYRGELADAQKAQEQFLAPPKQVGTGDFGPIFDVKPNDQSTRIASLKGVVSQLQQQWDLVSKSATNAYLQGRKAIDEANKANAPHKQEDYFGDAVKKLQAELQGAQGKAAAAATNPVMEALAKGAGAATKQIEELNKQLTEVTGDKKARPPLNLSQVADISGLQAQIALAETVAQQKQKQQQADERSRDERLKGLDEELAAEKRLTEEAKRHNEEIAQAISDLKNQTQLVGYEIDAVRKGGGRDQLRAARDAQIRGEGRQNGLDPAFISAQVDYQHKLDALQDAQRGVGQTALQGVQQYLREMSDATESVGKEVHDVLGGAFQGLNEQLTAIISGQHASWSNFFRSIAAQLAQISLNNIFGKLAGGALNSSGGSAGALGGLFGGGAKGLSGIFSLFGKGSSSLVSSATAGFNEFGGFMAEGGPLSPGKWYIAGEHGPEPVWGGGVGAFASGYGGGSSTQVINIDNRGAQSPAQVEMQTRRAARQAFQAGAQGGVALGSEKRSRLPRSKALYS